MSHYIPLVILLILTPPLLDLKICSSRRLVLSRIVLSHAPIYGQITRSTVQIGIHYKMARPRVMLLLFYFTTLYSCYVLDNHRI